MSEMEKPPPHPLAMRYASDLLAILCYDKATDTYVAARSLEGYADESTAALRASLASATAEVERLRAEMDDTHSYLSEIVSSTTGEGEHGPDLPLKLDEMAEGAVKLVERLRARNGELCYAIYRATTEDDIGSCLTDDEIKRASSLGAKGEQIGDGISLHTLRCGYATTFDHRNLVLCIAPIDHAGDHVYPPPLPAIRAEGDGERE